MILSLDISSSSTGWSRLFGLQLHSFGVIIPTGSTHAEKLADFYQKLLPIMEGVTDVVLEDAFSGRNKKVFKILSLYHGVAMLSAWHALQKAPTVMMPSRFRRICGAVYGRKLAFQERDDAKKAVFDLAQRLYPELAHLTGEDNDITDAVVIGLAHFWMEKATEVARGHVRASNPKMRSAENITKKAAEIAEQYLESHHVDTPSEAGGSAERKPRRSKKGV